MQLGCFFFSAYCLNSSVFYLGAQCEDGKEASAALSLASELISRIETSGPDLPGCNVKTQTISPGMLNTPLREVSEAHTRSPRGGRERGSSLPVMNAETRENMGRHRRAAREVATVFPSLAGLFHRQQLQGFLPELDLCGLAHTQVGSLEPRLVSKVGWPAPNPEKGPPFAQNGSEVEGECPSAATDH